MKPSQSNDITGFVIGAVAAGGLWWLLPFFHWAVYLVFGMMVAGFAIMAGGIMGAAERTMDRE